ncbi:hypothetical protein [Coleofasciculus sp. D1-CHI-01]|uniref:hypothetical protein n=1 Tax=Coleofasciculus sp. D1-CHI-01 TaxID=3068482 RepID=UPI0040638749
MGQVLSGNVREVVVNRQERLVRFGLNLIEWSFKQKDGKLVVLNRCYLSNQLQRVEDILAIVQV